MLWGRKMQLERAKDGTGHRSASTQYTLITNTSKGREGGKRRRLFEKRKQIEDTDCFTVK